MNSILFIMKKSISTIHLLAILSIALFLVSCSSGQRKAGPEELVIVAHVTIKPGHQVEVEKAFKSVVDGTRKEKGNILYILYQDVNNPMKYTFYEIWDSQKAINTHNGTAHFKEFAKTIEGKADLEVYTMKEKF